MAAMMCALLPALAPAVVLGAGVAGGPGDPAGRSPENYVYQYLTTQTYTVPRFETQPGVDVGFLFSPHTSTAYLWLPPACRQVRGVVILGDNVPEQGFGGHPALRAACAEQELAIVYGCPSMRLSAVNAADGRILTWEQKARHNIAFLQQILDALAVESGHDELRRVPWLPIGESMSLQIVSLLTRYAPERCIAGVWVKDAQWDFATPAVPMLAACGTGAEWDFPKFDPFERWREMAVNDLKDCLAKRQALPEWPGSLLVEAGSAHFSCTEAMAQSIARYVRAAARARLTDDGALRPVDLSKGYVARPSVPGTPAVAPKPYARATPEERRLPWYFDRALAQAAVDLAAVDWQARTQVPAFTDPEGRPIPFNRRGVTDVAPVMGPDGISFTVNATFLDHLPDGFVKAGTPLTHVAGQPVVTWLRGPAIPLGRNRFQLALDRTAAPAGKDQTVLLLASHPGDGAYHLAVHPAFVHIPCNKNGRPQQIAFDEIPDQGVGVKGVGLHAVSDAGLPVRFYVKVGPARVRGDRLEFVDVPRYGRFPLKVTVVAWQWGHGGPDPVQSAPPVERTFLLRQRPGR